MQIVGAASGDRLDIAAGIATVRRVVQGSLNDKLLNAVGGRHRDVRRRVRSDGVRVDTIDSNAVARRSLAVDAYDRIAAPQFRVVRYTRLSTGRKGKKLLKVSRRQRQLTNCFARQYAALLRSFGLNYRSLHVNGRCAASDRQLYINGRRLGDVYIGFDGVSSESRCVDLDTITSRRQKLKAVDPISVGRRLAAIISRNIRCFNGRTRNNGPVRIGYRSCHMAGRPLPKKIHREKQQTDDGCEKSCVLSKHLDCLRNKNERSFFKSRF